MREHYEVIVEAWPDVMRHFIQLNEVNPEHGIVMWISGQNCIITRFVMDPTWIKCIRCVVDRDWNGNRSGYY